jgi:hypothetical protein
MFHPGVPVFRESRSFCFLASLQQLLPAQHQLDVLPLAAEA